MVRIPVLFVVVSLVSFQIFPARLARLHLSPRFHSFIFMFSLASSPIKDAHVSSSLRRVRERWRDSRACLALHRSRREMLLQLLTYHSDSITHRSQFGCGYSTTHVTETAVGHHQ